MTAHTKAATASASGPERDKAQRLDELLALVGARHGGDEREMLATFCRVYFRQVDPEDVAERSAEDLYAVAWSHLQFARERTPGAPRRPASHRATRWSKWSTTTCRSWSIRPRWRSTARA
ncbi:MAG: hypothetical protein MUD07_11525 [Burkholderiaceae bacterium]|nr:hypothetical protein [Burkholderiaceae bacterium]